MKIALLQIKNNRKIYRSIWGAYAHGCLKHGIRISPNFNGNEDLVITCTDTWDKVKNIFNKCKQSNIPYITNYVGHFNKEKILTIDDRERERDNPSPETVIFCNYIDFENKCHKYICNNGDRYKEFSIKIIPQRHYNGYILLLSQYRPEYFSLIKNRQQWYNWAKNTVELIKTVWKKDSIILVEHPNEIFFKDDKKEEVSLYDLFPFVSKNNCPFDILLSRAHAVLTLSSKASVHALLNGVPVYSWEQYSPAQNIFNKQIQNINQPFLFDTQSWFKDIVYSYWTLKEIAEGKYIDYLIKYLLYEKN